MIYQVIIILLEVSISRNILFKFTTSFYALKFIFCILRCLHIPAPSSRVELTATLGDMLCSGKKKYPSIIDMTNSDISHDIKFNLNVRSNECLPLLCSIEFIAGNSVHFLSYIYIDMKQYIPFESYILNVVWCRGDSKSKGIENHYTGWGY